MFLVCLLVFLTTPPDWVSTPSGGSFSGGPELLPSYENLAKGQLLPSYAHFLSVTFTVLPQTHNFFIGVLRVPPPATCMSLCDLGPGHGPGPLTAWSHRHAHRTSMRTVKGLTRLKAPRCHQPG